MKKYFLGKSLALPLILLGVSAFSSFVSAANVVPNIALPAGSNIQLIDIIEKVISFVWPLFGAFSVFMFIRAGVMFLMANGDTAKVSVAWKSVLWGSVGLAVAFLSTMMPYLIKAVLGLQAPPTP